MSANNTGAVMPAMKLFGFGFVSYWIGFFAVLADEPFWLGVVGGAWIALGTIYFNMKLSGDSDE